MKNLIDDRGFISILDGDDSLEIDVPTTFNEPITFGTGSALIFNGNTNPRKIYVTLSGSDTTGDGSFLNPYRTVAKGVQVANNATNRALTTPYVIDIGAGTFTETQFPIFVSQSIMIKGQGGNMTRITSAQTGITFF